MEKIIDLKNLDPVSILGIADSHLKLIQKETSISIIARGSKIKLIGKKEDVHKVHEIFQEMIETLNGKGSLLKNDVKNLISL